MFSDMAHSTLHNTKVIVLSCVFSPGAVQEADLGATGPSALLVYFKEGHMLLAVQIGYMSPKRGLRMLNLAADQNSVL